MVFTFFIASNLKPWAKPRIYDIRITLDKFAIVIDLDKNTKEQGEIESLLNSLGAEEVNEKNFKH